jgi:hypothetical protein
LTKKARGKMIRIELEVELSDDKVVLLGSKLQTVPEDI